MVFVIHWHESAMNLHVFPIILLIFNTYIWGFISRYKNIVIVKFSLLFVSLVIRCLLSVIVYSTNCPFGFFEGLILTWLLQFFFFQSVQSLSLVQLFVTPWTAACQASLFLLPQLPQTHVLWVGDAIQTSYPLSSSSLPAFNLSQHQGLFHWVGSSHLVAKKESEVTQPCLTLCCRLIDYSLPGSSIHGIFQARILEWVAISLSRAPSWPRDQTLSLALQADSLPSEPPGKPRVAKVLELRLQHQSFQWIFRTDFL